MQPEPYRQQNVWAYIISLLAYNQLAMLQQRCITVQEEALLGTHEWGMALLPDVESHTGTYVFTHLQREGYMIQKSTKTG